MRRYLALVAVGVMLMAPVHAKGRPAPTGTLTRVGAGTPITFTSEVRNVGRRDHVWVSMHCWLPDGSLRYYGEEIKNASGQYVMDDTVWVLWTPPGSLPQAGDSCRAFLLFRDEATPGEVVLDDSGFFTVT